MRLIFFGTPEIAAPSLEYLINKQDIDVAAVVTQPDRPSGRGNKLTPPPVKVTALKYEIQVFQPNSIRKEPELIETLKQLNADVFISFAFGQILSQEVIDIPRLGIINLHASLLPKYRGANPIQRAIVNGDKVTGVTTMLTSIGVDEGDIILKKEIEINEDMNSAELAQKIAEISPKLIYESIIGLNNGTIVPAPQNHGAATRAPKFKKEDGIIDWSDSAINIHNRVRGLYPWPSAYTAYNNTLLKIISTKVLKDEKNVNNCAQGEIMDIIKEGIKVATGDGIILIKQLQPAGKKEMDAKSWANGAKIYKGYKGCKGQFFTKEITT